MTIKKVMRSLGHQPLGQGGLEDYLYWGEHMMICDYPLLSFSVVHFINRGLSRFLDYSSPSVMYIDRTRTCQIYWHAMEPSRRNRGHEFNVSFRYELGGTVNLRAGWLLPYQGDVYTSQDVRLNYAPAMRDQPSSERSVVMMGYYAMFQAFKSWVFVPAGINRGEERIRALAFGDSDG